MGHQELNPSTYCIRLFTPLLSVSQGTEVVNKCCCQDPGPQAADLGNPVIVHFGGEGFLGGAVFDGMTSWKYGLKTGTLCWCVIVRSQARKQLDIT